MAFVIRSLKTDLTGRVFAWYYFLVMILPAPSLPKSAPTRIPCSLEDHVHLHPSPSYHKQASPDSAMDMWPNAPQAFGLRKDVFRGVERVRTDAYSYRDYPEAFEYVSQNPQDIASPDTEFAGQPKGTWLTGFVRRQTLNNGHGWTENNQNYVKSWRPLTRSRYTDRKEEVLEAVFVPTQTVSV